MKIKSIRCIIAFYCTLNSVYSFIGSPVINNNSKARANNLQKLTTLPKEYKDHHELTNLHSIALKSADVVGKWKFGLLRKVRSVSFIKEPLYIYFFILGCVSSLKYQDLIILPTPNSLIHYGTYCGPGPDSSVNSPPIDAIDSICKDHDTDYTLCFPEDNLYGTNSQYGSMRFPKLMNQIISIRGKLPDPISSILTEKFKTYSSCIHRADDKLVSKLKILKDSYTHDATDSHIYNKKISSPIKEFPISPKNHMISDISQGVKETSCAIGLNIGKSDKLCVVSTKNLFISLALNLFDSDLEADKRNLI